VWEQEKEPNRYQENMKLLMATIHLRLNNNTQVELELVVGYQVCHDDVNLVGYTSTGCVNFHQEVYTMTDGVMSYGPFRIIVAVKALLNFTNQMLHK
jgi:hypothetical protein